MQVYVDRMQVVGNTFVNVSLVTRGNAGIEIADNVFCQGTMQGGQAVQRGNRMTCDGLRSALDRAPGGAAAGPVAAPQPRPAPKNPRVRKLP